MLWDIGRVDSFVATLEEWSIFVALVFTLVIILLRPKRTWVQWGVTSLIVSFNLILVSGLVQNYLGLETLPQPWRLIVNTVALGLILFFLAAILREYVLPLFRDEQRTPLEQCYDSCRQDHRQRGA